MVTAVTALLGNWSSRSQLRAAAQTFRQWCYRAHSDEMLPPAHDLSCTLNKLSNSFVTIPDNPIQTRNKSRNGSRSLVLATPKLGASWICKRFNLLTRTYLRDRKDQFIPVRTQHLNDMSLQWTISYEFRQQMVIYTTYDIPRVSSSAIFVTEIVKAYACHMHVTCAWI